MSIRHWETFSAAPHRMMMFGGALQLLATMLFWGAELVGRYSDLWAPLSTTIPAVFAHAFLMLYTLFPFFIFGFLMTTYPRWMSGPVIPRARYSRTFILIGSGVALYYLGMFTHQWLLMAATALILAGYGTALHALWQVYRTAPARDKLYETLLNTALASGTLGVASYLGWLASGNPTLLQLALTIGLWWFMLPIAVTVAHRMIPFFSLTVLPGYQPYQPRRSLGAMFALCLAHGLLEVLSLQAWTWLVDLPLLLLTLLHTLRWDMRRSFAIPLLAMLHVAFAWLSVALALYAVHSLLLFSGDGYGLGRAPLHAAAIGFLLSLTLGMASRVTLGHSGRQLNADTTTWVLFWGLGIVALLRIVAEWPAHPTLHLWTAGLWFLVLLPWFVKYAPIYLRPRLDGKPG